MALSLLVLRAARPLSSTTRRPFTTTTTQPPPHPRLLLNIDYITSPNDITKPLVNTRIIKQGYAFFRGGGINDSLKLKHLLPVLFEGDIYDYVQHGGIYTGTRKDRVEGVYDFVNVSTSFWDMPAHNDLSYRPTMAGRVAIAQYVPAQEGGCTPLYDMRYMWIEMVEKYYDLMVELHKYGLLYTKNLPDENNVEKATLWMKTADIPTWQSNYPKMTKQQVQELLVKNGETVEWQKDGTLRQTWHIPAYRNHPKTGERFFCNQLLGFEARNYWQWPGRIFSSLPFLDQPTHVRVGNGRDLTDEEYLGILDIHHRNAIRSPWHSGDVVVMDNVRMVHGRDSYKGDRHLAISWGDPM